MFDLIVESKGMIFTMQKIRESRYLQWALYLFVLGCALHIFLALRSWIGGDQIYLLSLGLDYSLHGHLQPFAKMMSGAGANPGILMQLLVGIPLMVLQHFQSPMILIILIHIIGGALFLAVIKDGLGERAAFIAVIAYWLSPWRLYNAGFLWEPSYIFLPAAAHLWACYTSREKASLLPSFILGLSLFTAIQIHNSAFVLILLTVFLILRKNIKLRWVSFLGGIVAGSLTLIPALLSIIQGTIPEARASEGYIGWSFVKIYPALKGIVYWFTLGAIDMVRPLKETVFLSDQYQTLHGAWSVERIWIHLLQFICVLSVVISIRASWWWWRKNKTEEQKSTKNEDWLRQYAMGSAICLFVSAALSPIVLQGWQVVIVLHSAVLPVIVWTDQKFLQCDHASRRWRWLCMYVLFELLVIFTLAHVLYIFSNPGILPQEVHQNKELLHIILQP
jgi:hypothetical protein